MRVIELRQRSKGYEPVSTEEDIDFLPTLQRFDIEDDGRVEPFEKKTSNSCESIKLFGFYCY
jgi:hypothetical protein